MGGIVNERITEFSKKSPRVNSGSKATPEHPPAFVSVLVSMTTHFNATLALYAYRADKCARHVLNAKAIHGPITSQ